MVKEHYIFVEDATGQDDNKITASSYTLKSVKQS